MFNPGIKQAFSEVKVKIKAVTNLPNKKGKFTHAVLIMAQNPQGAAELLT